MKGFSSAVVSGRRAVWVRLVRVPPDRRAAIEGLVRRCVTGAATVTDGIAMLCPGADCASACGPTKNAADVISAVTALPTPETLRLDIWLAADTSSPTAAMRLIAPSHNSAKL